MSVEEDTQWAAAWERMLGVVPPVATDLRDIAPPAEAGYRTLREWIYTNDPEGLPRPTKELVNVIINIAVGNPAGAATHVKLGVANGLTEIQLRQVLAQCFLSLGLLKFNIAGLPAWQAYKEATGKGPSGE
jgi:alkylhydroperoxidase/carboxymuconolactone decarboxylase family protein YurZ